MILIPHTQVLSEKLKIIGNGFNIKSFQKKIPSLDKNKTKERVTRQPQCMYIVLYYIYYI
jgi:hypothetical protein